MGFVTLGIFVFNEQGMQGAILQMVNHGLITGALFLLVGVIYERTHDRTIAKMGGSRRRCRSTPSRSGSSSFASAGLPGLSGFVGEFLVARRRVRCSARGSRPSRRSAMILAAAYLLWMFQRRRLRRGLRLPEGPRPPPDRHDADRGPDARAARRRWSSSSASSRASCSTSSRARSRTCSPTSPRSRRSRSRPRPRRSRSSSRSIYVVVRVITSANADRRDGDGRRRGRRAGSRRMIDQDLVLILPLIAAIGTAIAVLVDRPHPARPPEPRGRRRADRPVGRVRGDRSTRTRRPGDAFGGAYARRRADDVPRPAVHLDRRPDDRLRARLPRRRAACRWPSSRSCCCSR